MKYNMYESALGLKPSMPATSSSDVAALSLVRLDKVYLKKNFEAYRHS
jgi:hypothetical protein